MANNFIAKLGVDIDKDSFNKELNNLNKKNNKITLNAVVNTEDFKRKLTELNKSKITLNNIDATGLDSKITKELSKLKKKMNDSLNLMDVDLFKGGLINQKDFQDIDKLIRSVKLLDSEVKKINSIGGGSAFSFDKNNKLFSMDKFINENSKSLSQFGDRLYDLRNRMNEATDVRQVKLLNKEFLSLKKEIYAAGQSGRTFSAELTNNMSKFSQWTLASTIVMQSFNVLGEIANNVKELDSAMTSLYKVTDETDEKYSSFLNNAIANAKDLGSSISDLVRATADFARLGYSIDESEVLGKTATLYKNIGDGLNIEQATKSIVSTMTAYKKSAEEAIDIVDIFNNVGNKFAIDSKGIGDALQRSASSLSVAGNTLEQSVAMITAANTIVQDPDVVGTALKSMSLRLTTTASELEEMGEATDYAYQNLSEYRDLVNALTKNKVDILGDNGEYKSTYDILKEISAVWKDMDNMSQSSLMKALFGVRQANVGASLLENFNLAEKALKEAENSAGSALEEQNKWIDSIEGKLAKLNATLESLSQNVLNSEVFKFVIDSLNTILTLIDKVVGSTNGFSLVLGGAGAMAGAKGFNPKDFIQNFKNKEGNSLGFNFSSLLSDADNEEISKIWKDFDENVRGGKTTIESFNSSLNTNNQGIKDYFKDVDKAKASQEELTKSVGKSTLKQQAANIAWGAFGGILAGAAINLTIQALDSLIVTQEELEQKAQESANAYKQAQADVEGVNAQLEENAKRIREIKSDGMITYAEQSELDKLETANKQLEKQLSLLKDIEAQKGYEAALDGAKALGEYNGFEVSSQEYQNKFNTGEWNEKAISKENLGGQFAIYEKYQEIMQSSAKDTEEWQEAQDKSAESLKNLKEGYSEINQYLIDYAHIYDNISGKAENELTSQEQSIKSLYERYEELTHQIDKALDPNNYYSLEMDDIFDTDGIELSKEKLLELARSGELDDLDLSEFENLSKAIEGSGLEADGSGSKIEKFKEELEALSDVKVDSINAMDLASGMDDTIAVFDQQKEQLNDLANLVEALGDNFTLTADEARQFANMFPELLAQGEVTANGLIKFNSDIVNSFISGKQEERKVDTEARINQLEAAKALLISKKAEAEAELNMAQQVANGELSIEDAKVQMMSNAERQLTQYLIDLGFTEEEATAAAFAAKSGNMNEYNRIAGKTAGDVANNLAGAMVTAANSTKENVVGMVTSLDAVGRQSVKVAQQMANVASGKQTYDGKVSVGGGAKVVEKFAATVSKGNFKTSKKTKVTAKDIALDNWIEEIKLDIDSYTDAIDAIDAQINVLKAQGSQSLDKYKSKSSGSKKKKKSKSKDKKEFSETFDWLSIAIERLEEQIEKLDKIASNTYKSWSVRNKSLKDEMGKVTDEIALQTAAYNVYIAQANSVGLSSHYQNLVKNGALDIEKVTDEKLAEKIKEYQKYYNAANETSVKIQELDKQLSDLYVQQFDNIVKYWEDRINIIETQMDNIETMIDMNEAQGMFSGKSYYEELIKIEKDNISNLENERKELISALNEGVNNGSIAKYSESWYELNSQINDVNSSILEANSSLIEFQNELRQLEWDIFDYGQERIEAMNDEAEFLLELLEKQKSFDENGKNTQYADARYEIMGIRYNTYMQQADSYKKAIKELDEQFKNDSLNKDYIERRQELLELQRESILSAEEEKQSIIDLIEEGYEAQLDALDKIIEKLKEQKDAEKDLYDYQKEIAEKTKNISQLEKQLNAYSTDSSEENQKNIQDLKNQLVESKEDLKETEYEKYLNDQEALLDTLYTSFEEWISVRLDDINGLINETIESINANSQQVSDTIDQIASDVGYELDKPLKDIITANDNNSNNMYDLVTKYDENFSNKMTAVKTSIDNIYISVSQLVKKSEDEAKKKLEEQKKQQQNIVSNKKPSSSGTSSGSSSSSSNKGSSSSSSKGGFFVKKKFNGNKKSLNINNSIVDRLKYRDFDSSFSRRGIYYKAMGGSGKYTGSSKQNIFMLNWMKKNGYSHSGSIKSMINTANEDGLFLGRKDDVVIAKQDWDTIGSIIDKARGISSSNFDNSMGDVYIQMDLSSITNYEEFMNKLKSDKTFIKYIKASINSSITGKNNFRKNRFM